MFEDFQKWNTAQTLRQTGGRPAEKTLLSKVVRLRGACAIAGVSVDCPEATYGAALAQHLGSRAAVDALLDLLYLRHAPNTVCVDVHTLRQFGQYAVLKGWIEKCALESSDARKAQAKPITVFSGDEVDRLMLFSETYGNVRQWVLFALVAETGMRIGEALALRWDSLRLDVDKPHFDLTETKGSKQRLVPLTRRLRHDVFVPDVIESLKAANLKGAAGLKASPGNADLVFGGYGYAAAQDALKALCRRARVPYRSWHCLRHTYATRMLAKGVPLVGVSKLLGHNSVTTTDQFYNHTSPLDFTSYVD
jgi:integrase